MILVTGADGLVGSAFRDQLDENTAFFATRRDADLTDFSQTQALFQRVKPDRVVHLAAVVGGIGGNIMYAGDFFVKNALINLNVLEAARVAGVERLLSFMSTCIFPDEARYPLTADQLHSGPPHPSNFGYAYAKRMLEVQTRAYREQFQANFTVAIPTNIYGPCDNWSLMEGHVVPSLIHKVYKAKQSGTPLVVWGSGRPLREFIYSADVASLALWMLDNYDSSEPLILTTGVETSIQELVSKVVTAMDFDGPVEFDVTKPDGQFRKPSDAQSLRRLVPNFRFTPLNQGISITASWFTSNYPNVRM